METVITRDTDIIREYIAVLDARERGLSPFARLAATVKLARLRRELNGMQLETTDEEIVALRREIDERLNRTFVRRFEAHSWGARLSIFLMLVAGQQLVLLLMLLLTMLFVQMAPVPKWWNPVLPYEEPVFLYIFIFLFFFVTPMLALAVLFGGRYYRSWRRTLPATLIIFALSVLATFLVVRGKEINNPMRHSTSLKLFAKERGLTDQAYREWVEENWLMKDVKFQRDYETYLRNGPGRWITSRFNSKDDAAWGGSLGDIGEFLDNGQDPDSFREWLKYYLDRNRIYSEDRIDQEVQTITGEANQRFLGVWQVEPYLKERDERMYRAYLGSINKAMKGWGLASLGLFTLVFLMIYLTGPALSFWESLAGRVRVRVRRSTPDSFEPDSHVPAQSRITQLKEQYYSFPERRDITTPPFFDTPFKLLSRVHRSFVRFAVFTSIFVFAFWAVVYAIDLAAGGENAPSQVALMRSHLLFGGPADDGAGRGDGLLAQVSRDTAEQNFSYATSPDRSLLTDRSIYGLWPELREQAGDSTLQREKILAARLTELERMLDEIDYQNNKRFKEQNQLIASQRKEIDNLRSLSEQLQQTTSPLAGQIAALGSRPADGQVDQALGEATAAKQKVETVEKQFAEKLDEFEKRAADIAKRINKVEDQTSKVATRADDLEKSLDPRLTQIEAQTLELGNRTAGIKEREERVDRLQRAAFAAILTDIKADVEDLGRRVGSAFYRFFNKGEARRDADSLRQRIDAFATELREANTDQAKQMLEQLDELGKRVEQMAARVK